MKEFRPIIEKILPDLISLRHSIHAYPELAFEEHKTAETVVSHLDNLEGISVESGVAGTGVLAVLGAEKQGPCVALRGDMDALPIQEESDLPYASTRPGLMHACGHDGHTTCLVGAAKVLAAVQDSLPGPVKFLFQPAEEKGAGAEQMTAAGVLENPKVDAVFALHGWPWLPQGVIGVGQNEILAGSQVFEVFIDGCGGHAARPHLAVDPIIVAAQIVTALQTIVSRNVDPQQSLVLTVGAIQSGDAHNIIPERAVLKGTMRGFSEDVLEQGVSRVEELSTQIAAAFKAKAEMQLGQYIPPVVNDPASASLVAEAAKISGMSSVTTGFPVMISEDFSHFSNAVPGCLWGLGVCPDESLRSPKLHQPTYDFPDEAIAPAVEMHCRIVERFYASKEG